MRGRLLRAVDVTTVTDVFTAAALVPSPPVIVPELNGARSTETEPLRASAVVAARRLGSLATRWTVVGVGDTEQTLSADSVGTFRGFGVDVRVGLSERAGGEPDPWMPLAALIAGWLREQVAHSIEIEARILAADTSPVYCAGLGAELRRDFDASSEPHGLLVVADGAATLTAKAPGSYDERSLEFQDDLTAALRNGDCAALEQLDPVVCLELGVAGRAAYQVLAGVFDNGTDGRPECTTLYADAPFGVGYHVGFWMPGRN